ncbi:MAG: hypothetical protein LBH19_12125 [Dysgonamonadaceae bacterium]|jgi:RHS repeat-associated protein|nr:hypothetical protein [Dysgonamonadaceae bacterium]
MDIITRQKNLFLWIVFSIFLTEKCLNVSAQNNDFEWRSLNNAVMGFTMPDPLMEKYYAISPYVYCGNNPMNAIDPNGMNVYFLNQDGRLTLALKNDDEYDRIASTAKNEDGSIRITSYSANISDQNLLPMLAASEPLDSYHGITTNKTDAFNVFKFAADNSNVEWSLSGFKDECKAKFYINTQHSPAEANTGESNGIFEAKNMLFNVHSHPDENGTKGGSGYDFQPDIKTGKTYLKGYNKYGGSDGIVAANLFNATNRVIPLYVYHRYSQGLYKYDPWHSVTKSWLNIKSGTRLKNIINP